MKNVDNFSENFAIIDIWAACPGVRVFLFNLSPWTHQNWKPPVDEVHSPPSKYLLDDVERVQKRALRINCPDLSYRKALEVASLPSLSKRRNELCRSHFMKITDPNHKLHHLLPDKRTNNLRNNDNFTQIWSLNDRFKNSFIPSGIALFNSYTKL